MKVTFLASALSCFLLPFSLQATSLPVTSDVAESSKTSVNQINLNTADAKTLSNSIKGIGLKRAEAIIKYRETHDGFKSVNDLSLVPGIGKNFVSTHLEKIQQVFTIK